MHQVVYVSAASTLFTLSDLLELLTLARDKNLRLGVTGMLLYRDGDFIQLLEGEKSVVQALLATIMADPRHSRPMVIFESEAQSRLFSDWSMGFRNLSDPEVQTMPGFSDFMNVTRLPDRFYRDPNACLALLAMFKPGH